MGFAMEGKPWTPPKRPPTLFLQDGAAKNYISASAEKAGHRRACVVTLDRPAFLLDPKNARKMGKWLIRFANWADKKYKPFYF